MTLSPKHLTFDEMWQLYKQLKPGMPKQEKEKLVDEVIEILKSIPHQNFLLSLRTLFGKGIEKSNSGELGLLFVQGIKENKFFLFYDFIKRVSQ